jgi:branched-subunit amino acid aminotransferase/4-amino-4-deoxychorismate lyase
VRPVSSNRRAEGAPPDALRETCRVVGGRIPLWPYHHQRLVSGGCTGGVLDRAEQTAFAAAAEWETSGSPRVRLSVTVGRDGEVDVDVRRRLSSLDVPLGPIAVRVDVEEEAVLPAGAAKPADRGWWDDAQRAARFEGGHQAVIVGPDGDVIDGGTATVWIAEGPQLITGPAPPAVAGVARAFLLAQAPHIGIRIQVEAVSWRRFEVADEAFFTNALAGAVAARDRGRYVFGAVHEMFDEVWRSS